MISLPFPSFDPPPETSPKEDAAYQKGYNDGVLAGKKEMGLYIPIITDALRNLVPYQEAYKQSLNTYMVDALQHILASLVVPLPVASEIVKARATELFSQLEASPTLNITVADPQSLKGHVPEFVTLNADPAMASTDINLTWGVNQVTASSSQSNLHEQLAAWLAETLELITTHQEEPIS